MTHNYNKTYTILFSNLENKFDSLLISVHRVVRCEEIKFKGRI